MAFVLVVPSVVVALVICAVWVGAWFALTWPVWRAVTRRLEAVVWRRYRAAIERLEDE